MTRFNRLMGTLCGTAVVCTTALASADTVRGYGRVMYYNNGASGGSYLPLGGARVHLIDDDGLVGDDTMKTGYTDENGRFDLTGSEDDWWGKPDPYIQVELETSGGGAIVESEILKINVTCSTPVRDETSGTINFGTFNCAGDAKDASAIFARIRKAYAKFRAETGESTIPRHGGKAAALFPATFAAGVPWTTEESIHWPGGYRGFDAVYHEFGHRIRHAQDGDFTHFLGDVISYSYMQQHWNTKVTNEGFAFNEGWAEYNAAINGTEDYSGWNMVNSGSNSIEGNVAAKLWKASSACGGFRQMWGILKQGNIHGWPTFAAKLRAAFNASAALRAARPTCLANVVAALEAPASPPTLLAANPPSPSSTPLGAFAPTLPVRGEGPKVAPVEQTAVLNRLGASAKTVAATRNYRNPFAKAPGLSPLGGRLQASRRAHEIRSADKLGQHVAKLTPIPNTREAIDQRRAEHVAFVKEILRDQAALVQNAVRELAAERAKLAPNSREAQALDQVSARLNKRLAELRAAEAAGVAQRHLMPSSFSAAVDANNAAP